MGFNTYNSGCCKCHRSYTGEKIEYKAKHGKENQMQELVSLRIPIKEIYIYIFNKIKYIFYKMLRKFPRKFHYIFP